jgi:hypothetical protein
MNVDWENPKGFPIPMLGAQILERLMSHPSRTGYGPWCGQKTSIAYRLALSCQIIENHHFRWNTTDLPEVGMLVPIEHHQISLVEHV